MTSWWKILLGLVLVLPLGAYVTGSLVASAADDQRPREVLRIDPPDGSSTGPATPARTPHARPTGGIEVITPEYDDLDRRHNAGDDDSGGDRHGGRGSGHDGSDSSGHGGSGDGGHGGGHDGGHG